MSGPGYPYASSNSNAIPNHRRRGLHRKPPGRRAASRGHRVHVLDDLSTGAMDNIRHLKEIPPSRTRSSLRRSPRIVAELVDDADVVFHLAAAVGVELIVDSPVRTIETNVHCTEIVLAQANKKKKPVFIASTSEVYGKSDDLPFREDGDLLLGPTSTGRWSYACSKAIDEYLALAYWKERGLPVVIGRLFNTVGPRQTGRYGMVVPSFVRQALVGGPDHRLRGRPAAPLLLPRQGRRSRYGGSDGDRGGGGRGLQHRQHRGSHDARARRACARGVRSSRRFGSFRMRRPTRKASRTCAAAFLTSGRSASCSGGAPTLDSEGNIVRRDRVPTSAGGARAERVTSGGAEPRRGGTACRMKPDWSRPSSSRWRRRLPPPRWPLRSRAESSFHDRPVGYKAHARPTPYLGGAAVLGGFLVAAAFLKASSHGSRRSSSAPAPCGPSAPSTTASGSQRRRALRPSVSPRSCCGAPVWAGTSSRATASTSP